MACWHIQYKIISKLVRIQNDISKDKWPVADETKRPHINVFWCESTTQSSRRPLFLTTAAVHPKQTLPNIWLPEVRGVTRLDGARDKKQVWRPRVRTWCLSEANVLYWSTCDIDGLLAPIAVIRRPGNYAALAPLVTLLPRGTAQKHSPFFQQLARTAPRFPINLFDPGRQKTQQCCSPVDSTQQWICRSSKDAASCQNYDWFCKTWNVHK